MRTSTRGQLALLMVAFGFCFSSVAEAQIEREIAETSSEITPVLIGQIIPDAQVFDVAGKAHQFKNVLAEKPTVLVVFRGGWCIFCSRQLSQIAKSLKAFEQLGWQVVGLSPDTPAELAKATKDLKLEYKLYSDPGGIMIRRMGLAYKAKAEDFFDYPATQAEKDAWLAERRASQNNQEPVLPVPGVFLAHRNGLIVYQYVNVDYRVRLSGVVLLSAAKVYREKLSQ